MQHFRLSIDFTKKALTAMEDGKPFNGRLTVEIQPDAGRQRRRQGEDRKRASRHVVVLTEDEKRVLHAWNSGTPVAEGLDKLSGRNLKTSEPFSSGNLSSLRLALKSHSAAKIIEYVEGYFDRCVKGEHYHRQRIIAYKNLFGFLTRLNACGKNDDFAWWMNESETGRFRDLKDSAKAALFADLFAARFMGRKKYPDRIENKDFRSFVNAAGTAQVIAERYRLTFQQGVGVFLDALADVYKDMKVIYPAHAGNHKFRTFALPQYLQRTFG